MPRLVFLSDTHGLHNQVEVPDGDVLIHAGDFLNRGTIYQELVSFTNWWNKQPHKIKILVAGNHDILVQERPDILKNLLYGTEYLQDSGTQYLGLRFWGSPYTPNFFPEQWAFNRERGAKIKSHWNLIPEDTDILITHGPPYGILDQIKPNSEHLGCEELWKAVIRIKPKICCFGHIHGGAGETEIAITHFINASQVNDKYKVVHKPIVIDI